MENRNFIETVVHTALTKRELIELQLIKKLK